jgi:hypothetical protein
MGFMAHYRMLALKTNLMVVVLFWVGERAVAE